MIFQIRRSLDLRCVLLADPSTDRCWGQNRSRIKHIVLFVLTPHVIYGWFDRSRCRQRAHHGNSLDRSCGEHITLPNLCVDSVCVLTVCAWGVNDYTSLFSFSCPPSLCCRCPMFSRTLLPPLQKCSRSVNLCWYLFVRNIIRRRMGVGGM